MDVIIAYLETMFSPYPPSPRLDEAKAELRAMMEDAYSSLISEGKSHNEAVGQVITEFGNLDELAETLGISTEITRTSDAFPGNAPRDGAPRQAASPAGPDEGWESDGNREEGPVTAIVTSIYWALLIVAYFLWSFLGEGWGISWIIGPVGGVLFGAIHTVVDTLETRRRKRSR